MGNRSNCCTRIWLMSFRTGGFLFFIVAILLCLACHIIPTLTRNHPTVAYWTLNWMKHPEVQRLLEAGREHESIRASMGMWTVKPIGRLGNLMGQYATLYALAKLNRKQAYIQPQMHSELSKIFKLTLPVVHKEVDVRIEWTIYKLHDWMADKYRSIALDYVKLWGYPCSWTFYDHLRQEILREFTFHSFIKEEANAHLSQIRGSRAAVTFVGVHVRRGDYVRVMPQIWKGVLADKGYLKKAMDYFRGKYANPLFVVTSNDMTWCQENINHTAGDVHFAGDGIEGSPGRDFALLAHCNHTIMSVGTFGFWVGYLVGGETIYLTNFTLPESKFLHVFKYEKAYLPQWIGIPADLTPLLRNETQP